MAKADGSYLRELAKTERQDVIILDDFGLQALDSSKKSKNTFKKLRPNGYNHKNKPFDPQYFKLQ